MSLVQISGSYDPSSWEFFDFTVNFFVTRSRYPWYPRVSPCPYMGMAFSFRLSCLFQLLVPKIKFKFK